MSQQGGLKGFEAQIVQGDPKGDQLRLIGLQQIVVCLRGRGEVGCEGKEGAGDREGTVQVSLLEPALSPCCLGHLQAWAEGGTQPGFSRRQLRKHGQLSSPGGLDNNRSRGDSSSTPNTAGLHDATNRSGFLSKGSLNAPRLWCWSKCTWPPPSPPARLLSLAALTLQTLASSYWRSLIALFLESSTSCEGKTQAC